MTSEMVLTRMSSHPRLVKWDNSMTSEEVDIEGGSVALLELPTFSGTTLKVDAKLHGTWQRVFSEGSELSIAVQAGANVMPPELFACNGKVRFISDASETVEGYFHPVS